MKEYRLGICTNSWNALRYSFITLALLPAAEKLWNCFHSRRSGARLILGRTVRLRKSRLAHWGLHQEVDEESRLSRVSAIVVCLLHIAGALLLEYGSGSTQMYLWKDATVSPSIREDGGLRPNRAYFLDAGYVLGKPDGFSGCIDVGPRNLEDFGLRLDKFPASRIVPSNQISNWGRKADFKIQYFIPNSGTRLEVYDNGKTRWYKDVFAINQHSFHRWMVGLVNEAASCSFVRAGFYECSESNENTDFVSGVLASAAVVGTTGANELFRQKDWRVVLVLNIASIGSGINGGFKPEDLQTEWVRRGMPRDRIPRKKWMILYLDTNGLRDGCNQSHAMPASNLRKLSGLKVSKPTFFRFRTPKYTLNGEYSLVVLLIGNKTMLWCCISRKQRILF